MLFKVINPKIFICYRKRDANAETNRLYDHLCLRFGAKNVFIDNSHIEGGDFYRQKIENNILLADFLLVIIGDNWFNLYNNNLTSSIEDFVTYEICTATANGITVIPILINNAEIPNAKLLPAELSSLNALHYHELRAKTWKDDIDRLCRLIKKRYYGRHKKVILTKRVLLYSFIVVFIGFSVKFINDYLTIKRVGYFTCSNLDDKMFHLKGNFKCSFKVESKHIDVVVKEGEVYVDTSIKFYDIKGSAMPTRGPRVKYIRAELVSSLSKKRISLGNAFEVSSLISGHDSLGLGDTIHLKDIAFKLDYDKNIDLNYGTVFFTMATDLGGGFEGYTPVWSVEQNLFN